MCSVGQWQVDHLAASRANTILYLFEHGYIRLTKAVNRLAHIADDKQAPRGTGQGFDDALLAAVGILEFIHQDGVQLVLPVLTDGRIV